MPENVDLLNELSIDKKDRIEPPKRSSSASILVTLLCLSLILGGGAWWYFQEKSSPVKVKVEMAVVTQQPQSLISPQANQPNAQSGEEWASKQRGASKVLNATGYVTARRKATVSSKSTGRIHDVFIEEGMFVEEGQVLAELDSTNVKKELLLAQANLTSAEARRNEINARLIEARKSLARNKQLNKSRLLSDSELDAAQAAYDTLRAQLVTRQAEVESARSRVNLQQQLLDDLVIKAPFAGVVVSKNAQPGEMISPISAGGGFTRTGICSIVDMNSLEIEVDVNEAYINRVKPNQKVEALLDAYPEWKISAYVIAIIPTADRQKATVRVRIGFDELDARILPEMGIKVAFLDQQSEFSGLENTNNKNSQENNLLAKQEKETSSIKTERFLDVIIIPDQALLKDREPYRIFVVQGNIVRETLIKAEVTATGDWWVKEGLKPGERFVIDAPPALKDGDEVTIQ